MQKSTVKKLNIVVHIRQLKQQNERVLYFLTRTHVQNTFGKITNTFALEL